MSQSGDALLNRLRAEIELKTEVIKALRAERDHQGEAIRERMALLGAVGADLLDVVSSVGLLCDEANGGALRRAAERLKTVCADFADYMAVVNGQLVLSQKPVNIGRLLSRIATQHIVDVRAAPEVPERIVTDEAQFSRVLAFFVNQLSEGREAETRLLEVTIAETMMPGASSNSGDAAASTSLPRIQFTLHRGPVAESVADLGDGGERDRGMQTSSFAKLRTALAKALCDLMGAQYTGAQLILPVQIAVDQAHTGIFRLAVSERGAGTEPMTDRPSPHIAGSRSAVSSAARTGAASPPGLKMKGASNSLIDEDSVDLMYLDRQLGSLAPVILARTAPAFLADAQRRMTDLLIAHESENLARLEHIACVWKGSALSVGARALAALLDSIEKQASMHRLPDASAIWQVRSSLDRVIRALESQARVSGSVE